MSPPAATLPGMAPLSVDDVLMGEILMSLKRDSAALRRARPELSVRVPAPPPAAAFDLAAFCAVSPLAAAASTSAASPAGSASSPPPTAARAAAGGRVSPTGRALAPSAKRYAPVVQLEDLRRCFNMPIAAVARKFGICATLLKKICRRHGIQRWPHRQIRSLQKSIDMLRESLAVAKGSNREYIGKKIAAFELTLECIMQDPNTAARGIAAGRLATPSPVPAAANATGPPAATDPAKRRRASTTALTSPTLAAFAPALAAANGAVSDDEELRPSRLAQRRSSMSLESILC